MILPIVTGKDNSFLRKASQPVGEFDNELKKLVSDMRETLAATENGVGLAAPQVGKNIRAFIIDEEFTQEGHVVFINPQITKISSQKVELEEGCLSLPGDWHELARPEKATIKAFDENGERFKVRAKGVAARLMVHEVDHLNGILFIDHL